MDEKKFILIDLERSIATGVVHYWKPFRVGYTTMLHEVGFYAESEARDSVVNDFDRQTVAMSMRKFNELAGGE